MTSSTRNAQRDRVEKSPDDPRADLRTDELRTDDRTDDLRTDDRSDRAAAAEAATGAPQAPEAPRPAAAPDAAPAAPGAPEQRTGPRRGITGRIGPLLPARLRRLGRPHLLVELAFSVILYKTYSLTRRAAPEHHTAAVNRAHDILHAETVLHLNIEKSINHAVDKVDWLIVGMNYYYATLHFIVTLGVMVWLYARHPASYRSARTALYAATFIALIGFTFFALAPPRLMEGQGFIDTVVTHHTWGSWDNSSVSSLSNQYAAMPSVHIVWSAWSGLTVAALARRTWVRVLGCLYPLFTFTVILATGNHFLADAVAGAITLSLGYFVQRLLLGRPAYLYPAPDLLPAAKGNAKAKADITADAQAERRV